MIEPTISMSLGVFQTFHLLTEPYPAFYEISARVIVCWPMCANGSTARASHQSLMSPKGSLDRIEFG
jgi:hypothetical protein